MAGIFTMLRNAKVIVITYEPRCIFALKPGFDLVLGGCHIVDEPMRFQLSQPLNWSSARHARQLSCEHPCCSQLGGVNMNAMSVAAAC